MIHTRLQRTGSARSTLLASICSAGVCAFAPLGREGDPQKVTEERVRAAFIEARSALEREYAAEFDPSVAIRVVSTAELAQRIADENLPLVRRHQPDEEKARAEARSLADSTAASMFAKYSWSSREVLVVPTTLEEQARQFDEPEISSDSTLRALLVHELVHAWDDSTYGIAALLGRADSLDATNAINAVLEGHAQHVTRRVCTARGWSAGFDAYTGVIGRIPESSKALGEAVMATLRARSAASVFTYRDGERFIAALESAAGAEAIARAFREPPRDGETILRPDWYLDPQKRPAVLYDPEPAIDILVARFPSSVWSSPRQSMQSSQFEAGFALLPNEQARALGASIRSARNVMLYPAANPAEKIVALTVLEFGSETEARAFFDASDRLSKLKDDQMKTGVVRILSSSTATIQSEEVSGLIRTKQMKNGTLEFEVSNVDLLRGKVLLQTIFSGEPISLEDHVKLAVELLTAVRIRESK